MIMILTLRLIHINIYTMQKDVQSNDISPTSENTGSAIREIGCIDSETLLGTQGMVFINHQGQQYQLRETKSGKLILTK